MVAARLRGAVVREKLKNEEGGNVSSREAGILLGNLSSGAVLNRYKSGRLVGWRESRRNAIRFPRWQFDGGGVIPGLVEVLAILHGATWVDDWAVVLFFLNTRGSLGDRRPLDVLREGDVELVKRAALGFVAN